MHCGVRGGELAAAVVVAARFCSLIVAMEVERRRVRVENIMMAENIMLSSAVMA